MNARTKHRVLSVILLLGAAGLLALPLLFLSGCAATTLKSPDGHVARFQSNITWGKLTQGATTFEFSKMSNSAATNAAWRGTNELGRNLVSGFVSVAAPGGSGTATTAVRVIGASVPHVAPKEKSAADIWP